MNRLMLKQLVVFVRFLVEGKSQTSFLKIVDLGLKALLDICRQCGLIFSFRSDGASVMTGRRTGVATRLRVHNPEIIAVLTD